MKQTRVEAPRRAILERLKKEYHRDFEFPHVTQLIYCLTQAYWDQINYMEITDEEVVKFGIGHGLQRVLLPTREVTGECEGIHWSADQVSILVENDEEVKTVVGELKTTRMSSKKENLPEGWLKQIMAYCYATKTNVAHLICLHIMGDYTYPMTARKMLPPPWRLEFTKEELQRNWDWLQLRAAYLDDCIQVGTAPPPTYHCEEWECPILSKKATCRYELLCRVEPKGGEML